MRLAQYKEKAISREALEASYKEIKSGIDEAQRILGKVILTAQESDARYQAAIDEEEKRRHGSSSVAVAQERGKVQSAQKPTPKPSSLGEVKAKQASYQASVADAQKVKKEVADFDAKMAANMS